MTTNSNEKFSLELRAYQMFMQDFGDKKFGNQRLGQAFYNHFDLHKMTDQNSLRNLYEKDGREATSLIGLLFDFSQPTKPKGFVCSNQNQL